MGRALLLLGWTLGTAHAAEPCQPDPPPAAQWQYTSHAYRGELETAGTRVSMSRKGECQDNAEAESVFATIKVELAHR